jgi:hypothetical protein
MFNAIALFLMTFSPEQFCNNFLLDAEYIIAELGRIRQLALTVPMTRESYSPTNSVVDAVWSLEERLRFLNELDKQKKTRTATRRRRESEDDPPEIPTPNSRPQPKKWQRVQEELFDAKELTGLRSAELSRELRDIKNGRVDLPRSALENQPQCNRSRRKSDRAIA